MAINKLDSIKNLILIEISEECFKYFSNSNFQSITYQDLITKTLETKLCKIYLKAYDLKAESIVFSNNEVKERLVKYIDGLLNGFKLLNTKIIRK